jgi:hypothetical protein
VIEVLAMTENLLFTPEERKAYEKLAQRRGYNTLREYMHALIELDAEQHSEAVEVEDDELDNPVESFRRAWGEAMRGEGMSREEFRRRMLSDDD